MSNWRCRAQLLIALGFEELVRWPQRDDRGKNPVEFGGQLFRPLQMAAFVHGRGDGDVTNGFCLAVRKRADAVSDFEFQIVETVQKGADLFLPLARSVA